MGDGKLTYTPADPDNEPWLRDLVATSEPSLNFIIDVCVQYIRVHGLYPVSRGEYKRINPTPPSKES